MILLKFLWIKQNVYWWILTLSLIFDDARWMFIYPISPCGWPKYQQGLMIWLMRHEQFAHKKAWEEVHSLGIQWLHSCCISMCGMSLIWDWHGKQKYLMNLAPALVLLVLQFSSTIVTVTDLLLDHSFTNIIASTRSLIKQSWHFFFGEKHIH